MSDKNRPRVICVDDEPRVLEGLVLHLRKDYEVHTAPGGAEALRLLRELGGATVVVSDMRMPGMNGATFLHHVLTLFPDASRILLTGEPGRDAAIEAVNKARIFRFLTKPCPPEQLKAAVEDGVMQHRLIGVERSVLKETLIGCIKALTDVLAIANPVAFGRANRLKQLAMAFAQSLQCSEYWQLEAAALLSQIGYLSLPTELVQKLYFGEPLTPEETVLVAGVPDVIMKLLDNIPRLEPAIQILVALSWNDEQVARLGDGTIGLGTRILGLVSEYDTLITQGYSVDVAIQTLRKRGSRFTAELIERFGEEVGAGSGRDEAREMALRAIQPGMVIMQDVRTPQGTLLVPRGFEVTRLFLERIGNFGPEWLSVSVRVMVPVTKAVGSS